MKVPTAKLVCFICILSTLALAIAARPVAQTKSVGLQWVSWPIAIKPNQHNSTGFSAPQRFSLLARLTAPQNPNLTFHNGYYIPFYELGVHALYSLFAGTVPAVYFLYAGTLPVYNHFLSGIGKCWMIMSVFCTNYCWFFLFLMLFISKSKAFSCSSSTKVPTFLQFLGLLSRFSFEKNSLSI